MGDALLELRDLSKQFQLARGELLDAVVAASFSLQRGEVLGLVGESGSGKSTLGRMILGLETPSGGEIVFRGERLPALRSRKQFQRQARQISAVFQDPDSSLNPRMTIAESLAEPLKLLGITDNLKAEVEGALVQVGLSPAVAGRYPHEFSGGQRQRIAIARALITRPQLLICDEPVSALDVSVQAQIIDLLQRLQRELALSILFIAHDLSMVRYFCDRTLVMYRGSLVEQADSSRLFSYPIHPYTRELLEVNPLPDPQRERQRRVEVTVVAESNGTGGCPFFERCDLRRPECCESIPVLEHAAPSHRVACPPSLEIEAGQQ